MTRIVFGIDRQRRLVGGDQQLGTVVTDQLVGCVAEHPREIHVLRIVHGLVELDPQEAPARLGFGVVVPGYIRRQGDAGGNNLRDLRRRRSDGQFERQYIVVVGVSAQRVLVRRLDRVLHLDEIGEARFAGVRWRLHALVLGLHGIDEDKRGMTAIGIEQGGERRGPFDLDVADFHGLGFGRFVVFLEPFLALDHEAAIRQSIPGPIALQVQHQATQPVMGEIALARKGEGRVVGRQRVADALRTAELDALAFLCHQRETLVLDAKLLSQALHHVGRLLHVLAKQQAAGIAVEQEWWIGLQEDARAPASWGHRSSSSSSSGSARNWNWIVLPKRTLNVGVRRFQPVVIRLGFANPRMVRRMVRARGRMSCGSASSSAWLTPRSPRSPGSPNFSTLQSLYSSGTTSASSNTAEMAGNFRFVV